MDTVGMTLLYCTRVWFVVLIYKRDVDKGGGVTADRKRKMRKPARFGIDFA